MAEKPGNSILILTKGSNPLETLAWSRTFLDSAPDKFFSMRIPESEESLDETEGFYPDQMDQIPGVVLKVLQKESQADSVAAPVHLLLNPPLDQDAACLRAAIFADSCADDRLYLFGMFPRNQQNVLVRTFFSLFRFPVPFYTFFSTALIPLLEFHDAEGKYFPVNILWRLKRKGVSIRFHAVNPHSCDVQHSAEVTWLHLVMFGIGTFLRYSLSSLASLLVDNLVFSFTYLLSGKIGLSLIFGRAISMIVNYLLLRNSVFQSFAEAVNEENRRKAASLFDRGTFFRYLLLVIFSGSIVWLVSSFVTSRFGLNALLVKLGIEFIMFFVNYYLSKNLVFRSQR
ncbi:MAG: hypothetical protein GX933_07115 [Chloroflexi bacterium]|nr:hypothetical protein [Chloroflexota bacterium]